MAFAFTKPSLPWFIIALTILFVIVVRVRLREIPLERDEGEYAYAGQLMLHGLPPYKEVYNMNMPGTYTAYALIMSVFGQTAGGIHLGVMFVNVASILLLFLLARRLLDEAGAVAATLSFALMSLSPSILGLAAHATHFVVLFALGGILLLLNGKLIELNRLNELTGSHQLTQLTQLTKLTHPALAAAGLLFGLAFVMKQQGLFFGLFGLIYLVWTMTSGWLAARAEAEEARKQQRRRASAPGPVVPATPTAAPRLNALQRAKLGQEMRSAECGVRNDPVRSAECGVRNDPVRSAECGVRKEEGAETAHPEGLERQAPQSKIENRKSKILSPAAFLASVTKAVAAFTAGLAAPYALTCLLLWHAGAFKEFWFWTVTYAREYASAVSLTYGPDMLKAGLRTVVGPNLAFWLLPWAGALLMFWDRRSAECGVRSAERKEMRISECGVRNAEPVAGGPPSPRGEGRGEGEREMRSAECGVRNAGAIAPQSKIKNQKSKILLLLLLCSFGSVSVGLYFREHYFITLLPVLSLLTGVAVSRSLFLLKHDRSIELFLTMPLLLLFGVGVVAALVGNASVWFAMTPAQACRSIYGSTLFSAAVQAAEYIKTNAPPGSPSPQPSPPGEGDSSSFRTPQSAIRTGTFRNPKSEIRNRLAVLGSEPEIYFESGYRGATGFIYMYPLMEAHPGAAKMQADMIAEIERARPDYVVYVEDDLSWLPRPDSDQKVFEWWKNYWATNLDMVKTFDVQEGLERGADPNQASLGVAVPRRHSAPTAGSVSHLLVFRRKDLNVEH